MTQSFLASLELGLFGDTVSNQQQMQQKIAEWLRNERLFGFNSRNIDDFEATFDILSARPAAGATASTSSSTASRCRWRRRPS